MILTPEHKQNIISAFPYNYITHDRVLYKNEHPDMYMMVPSGTKCCIWISSYHDKPILYELYITNACKIYDVVAHFFVGDPSLAKGKGTICSGYSFSIHNRRMITLFDIMSLNGISLVRDGYEKRMKSLYSFFNLIDIHSTKNRVTIGMVHVVFNESHIEDTIGTTNYRISHILKCKIQNNDIVYISKDRVKKYHRCVFNVRALESSDIYELYCKDDEIPHSIAGIQTVECSVMMNKIFRVIRENDNLDLLEESDDDSDDYLIDNVTQNMVCSYNKKFNKWIPIKTTSLEPDDTEFVLKCESLS